MPDVLQKTTETEMRKKDMNIEFLFYNISLILKEYWLCDIIITQRKRKMA